MAIMAPHFSRLFGFFHSKKGGRFITRQKMTYCAVLFTVFGMLFFFPPDSHALDQEVDPTYRVRQIDEVFFGLDHIASSLQHKKFLKILLDTSILHGKIEL
jgi:hypothetical protein